MCPPSFNDFIQFQDRKENFTWFVVHHYSIYQDTRKLLCNNWHQFSTLPYFTTQQDVICHQGHYTIFTLYINYWFGGVFLACHEGLEHDVSTHEAMRKKRERNQPPVIATICCSPWQWQYLVSRCHGHSGQCFLTNTRLYVLQWHLSFQTTFMEQDCPWPCIWLTTTWADLL